MAKVMNPKMKSRFIAAALKQKIRSQKLPPGFPLPSAHDLTVQYKVCMATANRALDILEKESIIIRRNGSGNFVQKNIVQGRRLLLGIGDTIENADNYIKRILLDIFPETAVACFKAENCDYRMISYADFRDQSAEIFAGLDGILLSTTFVDSITEKFICSLKIPVVLYRSEYELELPFPQVIPDHSIAMNKLFDLAEQEKIPGIIILHHDHPNGSARGRVFEYYAKKHNFSEEQIWDITISTPADLEHKLLPLLPELSGKLLITCSSLINYDLIQLCIDNGLICGRDYQLVCYDNLKEKNIQLPPGIPEITSIDYSRTAAAQTAAKLLIHSVQNPHTIGCQTIKFPTSLRIKESAFTNRKELITL